MLHRYTVTRYVQLHRSQLVCGPLSYVNIERHYSEYPEVLVLLGRKIEEFDEMDGFGELMQLLENDIPECRRRLKESHANLEKVASYCEGNYLQVRRLH